LLTRLLHLPRTLPPANPAAPARIIFAFRQYGNCTEREIQRWEHNYRALSARHRALLAHLPAKAAAARRAVQQNQMFIKALLMDFAGTDEDDEQQQQQQGGGAGAGGSEAAGVNAAGSSSNEEAGDDGGGGGGVPGDLAAAALKFANQMEAQQQQCGPADAEKVRVVCGQGRSDAPSHTQQ
jgi:hypothetical protein